MSTGLLSSLLNTQSQTPTPAGQKMQVVMVPRELIMANPDNKKIYIVGDVSGLKDDIRENGVRQPLEVIRDGDGYKLIGGERRLTACKQLADEGDKRFESLPCLILDGKGELDDKIALITANATARDLTDGERVAQYEALKDALTRKKKAGQLEGKVRDECCRILGLSAGAAARLNIIVSCENETIKERLMAGEIKFMEAVKLAQDYAQYTKQKETPEEPEEAPKPASVETLPKESDKFPLWVLVVADDVCKKSWVGDLPEFSAKYLESCWHVKHCIAENLRSGSMRCGPEGIHLGNNSDGEEIFLTWERFVSFCIDEGIAPAKHAAKSAAKPVEPAKPAADLAAPKKPRGYSTLYKLAQKTLEDDAPWAIGWDDLRFQLEYYSQPLPGGAQLWKRVDKTKKTAGRPQYVCDDFAIILQDRSFYTCGWVNYAIITNKLTSYFELE